MIDAILRHIELLPAKVPSPRAYPFTIPAVAALAERLELHPSVTFFVGNNGSGKSTLVEAIAIKAGFNAEGGTKNFTGSTRPSESSLHTALRLARGARRERSGFFLRAETMFNVSTEAEVGGYGWESLHEMSHGEAFLWVAVNRFRDGGLFVLDEPEAALSPQRQLAFLRRLHQLVRTGSQFVISTHSPILMAYPNAHIWELSETGIAKVRYEDTEHYAVTRRFLMSPEATLRELFDDLDDGDGDGRPHGGRKPRKGDLPRAQRSLEGVHEGRPPTPTQLARPPAAKPQPCRHTRVLVDYHHPHSDIPGVSVRELQESDPTLTRPIMQLSNARCGDCAVALDLEDLSRRIAEGGDLFDERFHWLRRPTGR